MLIEINIFHIQIRGTTENDAEFKKKSGGYTSRGSFACKISSLTKNPQKQEPIQCAIQNLIMSISSMRVEVSVIRYLFLLLYRQRLNPMQSSSIKQRSAQPSPDLLLLPPLK